MIDVIDPATGEAFDRCPTTTARQLEGVVINARLAATSWARWSFAERRAQLRVVLDGMRGRIDEIARLLTREQGKPLRQAHEEISSTLSLCSRLIDMEIEPERLIDDDARRVELHHMPLGVVGVIAPWNAPVKLALQPAFAALYTGNTVIVKPSPYTPLATMLVGQIVNEHLPSGVCTMIVGDHTLGQDMTRHPGIDKIAFTGSVRGGKDVAMSCAQSNLKRMTLELGGNDAAIVLDDADVAVVAPRIFTAAFSNAGQICMAIKRLYVHRRILAEVCGALADLAQCQVLGPGLDPSTTMGPVQNEPHFNRLRDLLMSVRHSIQRDRRGNIFHGGHHRIGPGYFVEPTIVVDIADDSQLVVEEQFGPILPVLGFDDDVDAVRRANNTRYGLGGSVWSSNEQRATDIAMRLEVGTAWVNQHWTPTDARVPFGGTKESGIGRSYSMLGLKQNMEARVLSVRKG